MAILSMKHDISNEVDFENIDEFTCIKAKKEESKSIIYSVININKVFKFKIIKIIMFLHVSIWFDIFKAF